MSPEHDADRIDALTARVATLEDKQAVLQTNVTSMLEGQAGLRREMKEGFAAVDKRFDALDTRLDSMQTDLADLRTDVNSKHSALVTMLQAILDK